MTNDEIIFMTKERIYKFKKNGYVPISVKCALKGTEEKAYFETALRQVLSEVKNECR